MQFKVRNRLNKVDNIAGATIQVIAPATGTIVLTGTTNAVGVAALDLDAIPNGTYPCRIMALNTSGDPVGPALLSGGPVPERVYRPVTLTVIRAANGLTSATPTNRQDAAVAVTGTQVVVDVQPVWMRSPVNSNRGQPVTMVVVHHTACDLGPAVSTFLTEKSPHYMIDTDGQIVKWVQDARSAAHAGVSRWAANSELNSRSIGIEIVHTSGAYPNAQYTALIGLLGRILAANPGIDSSSIIGHSDIGTNANGRLGRKSGDPGPLFEWARLENRDLGLRMVAELPANTIYARFFRAVPSGSFRRGDNDDDHRFGGSIHSSISGSPVEELQQDLADIGYALGTPDGDFGELTHHAVVAFQEHFFAGGRGHKNPDGRADFRTAALIKRVAMFAAVHETLATGGAAVSAGVGL